MLVFMEYCSLWGVIWQSGELINGPLRIVRAMCFLKWRLAESWPTLANR